MGAGKSIISSVMLHRCLANIPSHRLAISTSPSRLHAPSLTRCLDLLPSRRLAVSPSCRLAASLLRLLAALPSRRLVVSSSRRLAVSPSRCPVALPSRCLAAPPIAAPPPHFIIPSCCAALILRCLAMHSPALSLGASSLPCRPDLSSSICLSRCLAVFCRTALLS